MTQRGEHTWDIHLRYHRCPKCGYVMESRVDFENRFGKYVKEMTCSRCKHKFSELKKQKPTFGPLMGNPEPAEFNWDTSKPKGKV